MNGADLADCCHLLDARSVAKNDTESIYGYLREVVYWSLGA